MKGYVLDTSALTPLVDPTHAKHAHVKATISRLGGAPVWCSSIALAEMMYGIALYERASGQKLPGASNMLGLARAFPRLDVDHHAASEYAELKASLAAHYLPDLTKRHRKRWVEEWIDKFTGRALGIDDNDLWICAQGRQFNFPVIADDRMNRIKTADPLVSVLPISP